MGSAWEDTDALEAEVRELLRMVAGSDIFELEVERDGVRIRLEREFSSADASHPASPVTVSPPAQADPEASHAPQLVHSPWVGVFHTSISIGDEVAAGGVIGEVEALGMRHAVELSEAGRVEEVFVSDGHVVEYGQPLVRVASG